MRFNIELSWSKIVAVLILGCATALFSCNTHYVTKVGKVIERYDDTLVDGRAVMMIRYYTVEGKVESKPLYRVQDLSKDADFPYPVKKITKRKK